jgi:virginiamycin B lyase
MRPINVFILTAGLSACTVAESERPVAPTPAPAPAPAPQQPAPTNPSAADLSKTVTIRTFKLPTAFALPHDVAVGADDSLWFTEYNSNKIGRLDPQSGTIREYPLKTANSSPRGIAVDLTGAVWFAAKDKGYIGKLDPATGDITEYRLPRETMDPGSIAIAAEKVWFTAEKANLVGKLDMKTGDMTVRHLDNVNRKPDAIVVGRDGALYFAETGSNDIGQIYTKTLAVHEYILPPGARPNRVAVGPDGLVYYSDNARGKIGRLSPQSTVVVEWPSPAGDSARPQGLALTSDGKIWFSESGVMPNTLVRFDPGTNRVAAMPLPGSDVRHIVVTPSGQLFLAASKSNQVALIMPRLETSMR